MSHFLKNSFRQRKSVYEGVAEMNLNDFEYDKRRTTFVSLQCVVNLTSAEVGGISFRFAMNAL